MVDGIVVLRIMQDVTVYYEEPSIECFEQILHIVARLMPDASEWSYKIRELEEWYPLAQPLLTHSGRAAAARGDAAPFLEPVRNRIKARRSFEFRIWDRREIDHEEGSYSFSMYGVRFRDLGLRCYARILVPGSASPYLLQRFTEMVSDHTPLRFLHGGYTFAYNTWRRDDAFDKIFAISRRFLCIDIEDILGSIGVDPFNLKSIGWITGLSGRARDAAFEASEVRDLIEREAITVSHYHFGSLFRIGPVPVLGDINRRAVPEGYFAMARATQPFRVDDHPDFEGSKFGQDGNTIKWLRRFDNLDDWR